MGTVTKMDGASSGRRPGWSEWDGVSPQSLAHALQPPVTNCVEHGLRDGLLEAGGLFDSLTLAVTTRTAFRLPVAATFIDAVEQRLHLGDELRVRMLTVLHEAVMNAILHGNLGLDSSLRNDFEDMARLQRTIARRLADNGLGGRMVFIEANWTGPLLYVLVRDCGEGFVRQTAPEMPDPSRTAPRGAGRGLCIIEAMSESVEYLNGGSVIRIGFER